MFRRIRAGLVVGMFAALSVFALGKEPTARPMDAADKGALHFLTPTAVDYANLLPTPPKLDSQEHQTELETLLRIQERRTDAEVARALSEHKLKLTAFTSVLGEWFTAENLPLTAKLIKNAEADSKRFSGPAKDHFARPRPKYDPRIKPVVDEEEEPSYPSGHATRGYLFASILAEIDPERRDALMDRGREIGWDRVIAGVHYPSDVIAGRVLAKSLFAAMTANPQFQKDLEAARAEFAAAKKKAAEGKRD